MLNQLACLIKSYLHVSVIFIGVMMLKMEKYTIQDLSYHLLNQPGPF